MGPSEDSGAGGLTDPEEWAAWPAACPLRLVVGGREMYEQQEFSEQSADARQKHTGEL